VGATVEADPDFIVSDGDVGGHVDEVAEDLARLGIVVAAHAAGTGEEILNSSVVCANPLASMDWTASPMQLSSRVAARPP
jgi:hypothetical protein